MGTEVSSVYLDVLDIRDRCCSKPKYGESWWWQQIADAGKKEGVGATALSLAGQSNESAFEIRDDEGESS